MTVDNAMCQSSVTLTVCPIVLSQTTHPITDLKPFHGFEKPYLLLFKIHIVL